MDPSGVVRGVPANATSLSDANIKLNMQDVQVASSWGSRTVTLRDNSRQKVELSMGKFIELAKGEFDKLNEDAKKISPGEEREAKLTETRRLLNNVKIINGKEKNAILGTAKRDAVIDEMERSVIKARGQYEMDLASIDNEIKSCREETKNITDPVKLVKFNRKLAGLEQEKTNINQIIRENWGNYDRDAEFTQRLPKSNPSSPGA